MTVLPTRPARLALAAAILAALLLPLGPAPTATAAHDTAHEPARATTSSWVPPSGPSFNNPIGIPSHQRRLLDRIIKATQLAPVGSTIRMAVFSFGDPETADALLAAYHRGVHVKLVFPGANDYPAMQRLQAGIGSDTSKDSFVVFCDHSCRGTKGEMHAKYFAFSRTGAARWVTMVGSVNVTQNNAQNQWADLYTKVDDKPYYKAYLHWFKQLRKDQPLDPSYRSQTIGDNVIQMLPLDTTIDPDPVVQELDNIRCEVPMGEIDPDSDTPDDIVRTNLDINSHAWNEDRGIALAQQVVGLHDAGCRVKVFYGVGMGAAVMSILQNDGIKTRKGTHPGIRTHQKVMVVQGGYGDDPSTVRAWTGSHNWSDRALGRDDLIVEIDDEAEAQQYLDRFVYMWDHA